MDLFDLGMMDKRTDDDANRANEKKCAGGRSEVASFFL